MQKNIILYTVNNNNIKVLLESETFWLTQRQSAKLFGVAIPTINEYIKDIFKENTFFLVIRNKRNRQVSKEILCKNLLHKQRH